MMSLLEFAEKFYKDKGHGLSDHHRKIIQLLQKDVVLSPFALRTGRTTMMRMISEYTNYSMTIQSFIGLNERGEFVEVGGQFQPDKYLGDENKRPIYVCHTTCEWMVANEAIILSDGRMSVTNGQLFGDKAMKCEWPKEEIMECVNENLKPTKG